MPDIILIDGGKAQLNSALGVFNSSNTSKPILLSIVKGAKRVRATETILSEQGILEIPINSPGFNLLQQVRDESHRFAITGNRRKQNKTIKYSALDQIAGLGLVKKRNLLNYFKSLDRIKSTNINDLCMVDGISYKLALKIKEAFNE